MNNSTKEMLEMVKIHGHLKLSTSIKVRTRLFIECALKKKKVLVLVTSSANVANWLRGNIRKGMTILLGMYTESYAGKTVLRGVRNDMYINRCECVRTNVVSCYGA